MWIFVHIISVISTVCVVTTCQFVCHDDPAYVPEEGMLKHLQFTWLGLLQYILVKNGTPHYFRVPRVMLIHPQFCITTAVDASNIPSGYALGNVIFGDYERDETECGISLEQLAAGMECEPAILLMPIADVLVHPDYELRGNKHSVAILKMLAPIKSKYVLPVCLPQEDLSLRQENVKTKELTYHVDYYNEAPRDLMDEDKEVYRLDWLPKGVCDSYDTYGIQNTSVLPATMVCTRGCGFHSGAPTIFHELTGHWTLESLAVGGPPCLDPFKSSKPLPSAHHIKIYPYVPWISSAITGTVSSTFAMDGPFGYVKPRSFSKDNIAYTWVGHFWMGGHRCFDRGESSNDLNEFYQERFTYTPATVSDLNYNVQIDAAPHTQIMCVKVGMPYQLHLPKVWGIGTSKVKVSVPLLKLKYSYVYHIEAFGSNRTASARVHAPRFII